MARHRKSPRSRRNLMVIDPLTPSQGHQFYRRLKFSVYRDLLLIPFNLICHMTMFRKLNFWPLPKAPGGGDPKNCAGACAIHVSNSHTKSGWISGKNFFPPLGMTQAAKWKSCLICYISFICEKTHKVWLKNLWNWLCNWNLMIFNGIWPFGPSPGPQGAGQKKMCCCTPHSCEQLTHQIWLDFLKWFRRR